jgi:hypothetical protein
LLRVLRLTSGNYTVRLFERTGCGSFFLDRMDDFIQKIETITSHAAGGEGGAQSSNLIQIGETLWNEVLTTQPTVTAQEELVIQYTKIIVNAVTGFSDYKDCFWDISHFLKLAIINMSPTVALECVKAGCVMYDTEATSDHFTSDWADAAIARCVTWIHFNSAANYSDAALVANLTAACRILKEVAKAGAEYKELISASNELKTATDQSIQYADQALADHVAEAKLLKRVKKELMRVKAMCLTGVDVLTALESSFDPLDLSRNCFFEAYNSMCERRPVDLSMQLQAAQGPLAAGAVNAMQTMNEGKNKKVFMEACLFISLLLTPWDQADSAHMAAKLQIAALLRDLGLVEALMGQFSFWISDWGGVFGDCGRPCLISMLELVRYFPNLLQEVIAIKPEVVSFFKTQATEKRDYLARSGGRGMFSLGVATEYEDAGSAAIKLEHLLEGRQEDGQAL